MKKTTNHIFAFAADRVRPFADQPRKRFRGIKELAASIAEVGQISPGIVTPLGDGDFDAQLIDGERRLRACRLAGVEFSAIVRPACSYEEAFASSFAANFGKQDHDVIEIAEGLQRMRKSGKTVEQLAKITGHSLCWVYQYLNVLDLHQDVRAMMVQDGDDAPTLTFTLAQMLVPLPAAEQMRLAKKVTAGNLSMAGARRLILKRRSDSGEKDVYRVNNRRDRRVGTLASIVNDVDDKIGLYLDMPGADLNNLIDGMDNLDKRQLIEDIEELETTFSSIKEAIQSRLPKLNPRRTA
jgi:ParB/RepB/Spo0J family partition protein